MNGFGFVFLEGLYRRDIFQRVELGMVNFKARPETLVNCLFNVTNYVGQIKHNVSLCWMTRVENNIEMKVY